MRKISSVIYCILLLAGCSDTVEPNIKISQPATNTRFQNGDSITIVATIDVPELVSNTRCRVYDSEGVSGATYYSATVAAFDTTINGEKAFVKSFILHTTDTTTAKIEVVANTTDGATIGKTQTVFINQ